MEVDYCVIPLLFKNVYIYMSIYVSGEKIICQIIEMVSLGGN